MTGVFHLHIYLIMSPDDKCKDFIENERGFSRSRLFHHLFQPLTLKFSEIIRPWTQLFSIGFND